jgi:transcriptional regulator with XRE-family HTH domain
LFTGIITFVINLKNIIMVERILSFIKSHNLTPSQFADEIGVQRSSISHLISGRNKPSLEFIQRIVARYPELNLQWILNGTGPMLNDGKGQQEIGFNSEMVIHDIPDPEPMEKGKLKRQKSAEMEGKQVEKIVFIFKDRTFR